ncbi:MAG TPA: cytochrome D1 domain-containing protein [Bacteroidales bacterium]|nr:cytochrome D1 domain-containing protein [Bacteroidales bacterium]
MKRKLVILALSLVTATMISAQPKTSEYRISKVIHLTGNGGWDYLSVDQVNGNLFVSHGTTVNVVDLQKGEEISVIPGTNGVHGIAVANDLNLAFISCGRDTSVKVVDLHNFKDVARIKVTGLNPDAILYDQFSHQVLTFNGRSSNATVIDAKTFKVKATIPLSGKPEFPQTDGNGKIYVNIEDKGEISIINARNLKVEKTWSIAPGEEPSGLALDAVNKRLFSVCGNKMMVVSDIEAGKVVTTVPIGDGCDGVAFDPEKKRIYASCGEGVMTIIGQESADKYIVVENMPTKQGARTITVNKSTRKVYLSVAEREQGSRTSKPDTFTVLEIEPVK